MLAKICSVSKVKMVREWCLVSGPVFCSELKEKGNDFLSVFMNTCIRDVQDDITQRIVAKNRYQAFQLEQRAVGEARLMLDRATRKTKDAREFDAQGLTNAYSVSKQVADKFYASVKSLVQLARDIKQKSDQKCDVLLNDQQQNMKQTQRLVWDRVKAVVSDHRLLSADSSGSRPDFLVQFWEILRSEVYAFYDMESKTTSLLHEAMCKGDRHLTHVLLEAGLCKNEYDYLERTPLYLAVSLEEHVWAEKLLKQGVKVDCMDEEGRTPLHVACEKGDLRMVNVLVAYKANSKHKDYEGDTPLQLARNHRHEAVVNVLSSSWCVIV